MDISDQVEIVLRDAGYQTWAWAGPRPVTCFEDASLIGFVHVFASTEELTTHWQDAQQSILALHAPLLRAAGAKAWNVYSVFLTADGSQSNDRAIERIEEDFALTRKIVRATVRTPSDVENALLPLILLRAQPMLGNADFGSRLRTGLKDIRVDALTAFLGDASAEDVARLLGGKS